MEAPEALQAIADEIELLETQNEVPELLVQRIKEILHEAGFPTAERKDWRG
ncbi:MAG: hypothetical protein WAM30_03265 [Candidatus Dormiibacterota bacterium]